MSFASLEGRLLSRKGQAAPAAKPAWPVQTAEQASRRANRREADDGRVRATLRLDRETHRRLKLLAAKRDVSLQHLIAAALDDLIAEAVSGDTQGCPCLTTVQGADRTGEKKCPR